MTCPAETGAVLRVNIQNISEGDNYDGFIFGSPVYYSGMNGSLMSFMDRVFFSAAAKEPHPFRLKAAAIVSARRAGTTSALDQMNKYFLH
jgi:multimeric flavodoxin WrbA